MDHNDKFTVNPDTTQMQYRYPPGLQKIDIENAVASALRPPMLQQQPWGSFKAQDQPPSLLGGDPGPSLDPLKPHEHGVGSKPDSNTTEVQIRVVGIEGMLHGHGHCLGGGKVYVRISVVDSSTGNIASCPITAHPNRELPQNAQTNFHQHWPAWHLETLSPRLHPIFPCICSRAS